MLTFTHPWLLYLIWTLPVWALLVMAAWHRRQRKLQAFIAPDLLARLAPGTTPYRDGIQLSLLATGLILLLLAAAGPQYGTREISASASGRDVVFLVDVSRSMLAADVHPSRLDRAKADLIDIATALDPGDRIALFAFRQRAARMVPFTTDRRFLRQSIQSLSIHSAPAGPTDIGTAILHVVHDFDPDSPFNKAVVLISDGEDLLQNLGPALEAATRSGIIFITLGIGTRSGATLPDPQDESRTMRHQGEVVITRLEEDTLQRIAESTGGLYIPMQTTGIGQANVGNLVRRQLSRIEAHAYQMLEHEGTVERYQWLLLPAFILLLTAGLLSRGRFASTVTSALPIILLSISWLSALPLHADEAADPPSHRKLAYQAQQLYRNQSYQQAAHAYETAAQTYGLSQKAVERYRLNAAIAHLASGNQAQAEDILRRITPTAAVDTALALSLFEQGMAQKGESANDWQTRAERWRESADLLQRIWRESGHPDAAHDLSLLSDNLLHALQQAERTHWIEEYADADASDLAWQMLQRQRALQQRATQPTDHLDDEQRLQHFEQLAGEWADLARLYYPLADKKTQAGRRDAHARLEQERSRLRNLFESIRDLEAPGKLPPVTAGHPLYDAWKDVAHYEMLLDEARRQQQDILDSPDDHTLDSQIEAAQLTRLFADRFSPPPDTDEEDISQILDLATDAERLQRLAAEMLQVGNRPEAHTTQIEARELLDRIADLLPQPPPEDQQDQEEGDDPDSDPQPDPQPESDDPDDDHPQEDPQPQPDPQTEPDPDPQAEPEPEDDLPLDIESMLERVQEREREYHDRQEERRRRMTPPIERDW